VTFNADANFGGATFKRGTYLDNVRFIGRANFDAIATEGAFSLSDATFREVPSFIGGTFKSTMRLDNVQTPRYHWLDIRQRRCCPLPRTEAPCQGGGGSGQGT